MIPLKDGQRNGPFFKYVSFINYAGGRGGAGKITMMCPQTTSFEDRKEAESNCSRLRSMFSYNKTRLTLAESNLASSV